MYMYIRSILSFSLTFYFLQSREKSIKNISKISSENNKVLFIVASSLNFLNLIIYIFKIIMLDLSTNNVSTLKVQ